MASHSQSSSAFEPLQRTMDKLPSSTLKRHPKMDLSKSDLLSLLSYLEGELQARDISIAALKAEKAKQLLYQAKYGRFGLGDPFLAMQRDSDRHRDNSFDEAAIKAMYDNQLMQLENLIETQRKAQTRMREQLCAVEKRYHKSLAELEEEKKKHAIDTAQGDDVTYMLEKERERLKQEVEFEKSQNKKLEKDFKKVQTTLEEEKSMSEKHKQVALMLIKERKRLCERLLVAEHRSNQAVKVIETEKVKSKSMAEGLVQESKKSLKMEAALEKQLSEFDVEREQLRGRLGREENKNRELLAEVQQLKKQLEIMHKQLSVADRRPEGPQSIEIQSSGVAPRGSPVGGISQTNKTPKGYKTTPPTTPPENRRIPGAGAVAPPSPHYESPERDLPQTLPASGGDTMVRRAVMHLPKGSTAVSSRPHTGIEKQIPVIVKPESSPRINIGSSGTQVIQASPGTTVFTTPQGTKISLNLGSSPNAPRKPNQQLNEAQIANLDSPALSPSTPNSDQNSPEMKDLQKLLVTMTTGPSASPSIEVPTKLPASSAQSSILPAHQLCECAASGNLAELRRMVEELYLNVNLAKNDGTTPVFCAAENGKEECLQYLLERQGNPNACQSNKHSAMNATAANGHSRCLKLLISYGGDVHQADQSGLTPAFCATQAGHVDCCRLLLEQGAKVDATNNNNWTPIHAAIERNDPEIVDLLLTYSKRQRPSRDQQNRKFSNALERVLAMTDKNSQTVYHLAAMNSSKACLEVLMQHSQPDLIRRDKNNKTAMDLASVACRSLLEAIANKNARTCVVSIEIPPTPDTANKTDKSLYSIGAITASRDTSWPVLEEMLGQHLQRHFDTVAQGLKSKKIIKCDHEEGDTGVTYALGLSQNSIKFYSIGMHYWSPGTPAGKSPYELLAFKETWHVKVHLFGWEDGCLDALAYESLISVAQLQNYLRLVEQYKGVVFYGSSGSGKTYLARKLAFCLQNREVQSGRKTSVHFVTFTPNTTCQDLMEQLVNKGCLLPSCQPAPQGVTPIIVLDNLGKVAAGQGFGDLLVALENRGPNNAFKLTLANQSEDRYYLIDTCYIIGTMDRSKNTGLELSAQQHFRWVQFRNDAEPTKHLLSRHLYRKMLHQFGGQMPNSDDPVYKAVEWVICVWLRLNEGVGKLNLPDLMFGPSNFLSCPVEISRPKSIMRWLCLLWNHVVAPAVGEAVVKGSGSETSATGQQKVASTALYVLMQRAVVHGCPLSGQEKERYLGGFQGSNELEIKMRDSRRDNRSSSLISPLSSDDEGFDVSWQHVNRTPGVGSPVKVSKDNLNAGLAQQVVRQASASPKLVRTRAARNSVTPDKAAVTS